MFWIDKPRMSVQRTAPSTRYSIFQRISWVLTENFVAHFLILDQIPKGPIVVIRPFLIGDAKYEFPKTKKHLLRFWKLVFLSFRGSNL